MKISKKLQNKIDFLAEVVGEYDIDVADILNDICSEGGQEAIERVYESYKESLEEE